MPTSLIAESPVLSWPELQRQTVSVTVTPRAGLEVDTDYGTFTLTIREDPEFDTAHGGRSGADKAAAAWADPVADGWEVVASEGGTVAGSVVSFEVTVPAGVGYRRYAVDVVADGGAAGRVEIVPSVWLTVTPSLKAA